MKKRLYRIYYNMKSRCYNPKATNFKYYGGRGITVCDEWKNSFQAFYDWAIENGYADNLTLDRRDNDDIYKPSNCRWADKYTQNNNTCKNHYITHNGETKTAAMWAREYGLSRHILNKRIRRGWDFDRATTTKKGRYRSEKKNRISV